MEGPSADYEALPQRAPRERRAKRARLGEGEAGADGSAVAAAEQQAPAAAAGGGGGAGPAAADAAPDDQQQAEPQQQGDQQPQQQQEEQEEEPGGGAAAEPAAAERLDLQVYRSAAVRGHKFEYLDHTADVQLHAWGETLREAIENCGLCMFNYMTPLKGISVDPALTRTYEAEGHDLQSLLFNFLDELLFAFATDFFVASQLSVTELDLQAFRIQAEGRGETFDRQRHVCGTEVKAITYSAMQINEKPGDAEVFVIVDI